MNISAFRDCEIGTLHKPRNANAVKQEADHQNPLANKFPFHGMIKAQSSNRSTLKFSTMSKPKSLLSLSQIRGCSVFILLKDAVALV